MWLQRGDKLVALKKFGLANFSTATDAEKSIDWSNRYRRCILVDGSC